MKIKSLRNVGILLVSLFCMYSCEIEERAHNEELNILELENKLMQTVLPQDSKLQASNSVFSYWFKGGTTVELDANGKVKKGTLLNNTWLRASGSNIFMWFKANTIVVFEGDANASLKEGVLLEDTRLSRSGPKYDIWFKGGQRVIFATGQEGRVRTGTLRNRTILPNSNNISVFYESMTELTFDDFGRVINQ
ncbi:hypothetical protein GCM10009430_07010 [Aquimarina litoralis]|uniref:Uncharacterized protein n=1 Tax=Aquimarina litoralis TaxID=584605 RepID=A0ABN1II22_9FLAO